MGNGKGGKSMDKEKEGVLGTIVDTAKTGMDAAIEGVSSAASAIADAASRRWTECATEVAKTTVLRRSARRCQ
jgi:hypothetical protein